MVSRANRQAHPSFATVVPGNEPPESSLVPHLVIIDNDHAPVFVALNDNPDSRLLLLSPYLMMSYAPPGTMEILQHAGLLTYEFNFPDNHPYRIGFHVYPEGLTQKIATDLATVLKDTINEILSDTSSKLLGTLQDASNCAFAATTRELYHPRNRAEVVNSLSTRTSNFQYRTHFRSLSLDCTQPHAKANTVMREVRPRAMLRLLAAPEKAADCDALLPVDARCNFNDEVVDKAWAKQWAACHEGREGNFIVEIKSLISLTFIDLDSHQSKKFQANICEMVADSKDIDRLLVFWLSTPGQLKVYTSTLFAFDVGRPVKYKSVSIRQVNYMAREGLGGVLVANNWEAARTNLRQCASMMCLQTKQVDHRKALVTDAFTFYSRGNNYATHAEGGAIVATIFNDTAYPTISAQTAQLTAAGISLAFKVEDVPETAPFANPTYSAENPRCRFFTAKINARRYDGNASRSNRNLKTGADGGNIRNPYFHKSDHNTSMTASPLGHGLIDVLIFLLLEEGSGSEPTARGGLVSVLENSGSVSAARGGALLEEEKESAARNLPDQRKFIVFNVNHDTAREVDKFEGRIMLSGRGAITLLSFTQKQISWMFNSDEENRRPGNFVEVKSYMRFVRAHCVLGGEALVERIKEIVNLPPVALGNEMMTSEAPIFIQRSKGYKPHGMWVPVQSNPPVAKSKRVTEAKNVVVRKSARF
ncbi:hypothetical protein TrCOL_g13306 [Triparma columacea]|uniref:Uncharacterized protein n=2 Tax=Triparma columacea TaxID=722753 RepID=A0A9W7G0J5_9STRA|nr:hypothetical protein TrCOL_g13306 [Triparma columacea]